jgi:hypothetical protein
MGFGLSAVKALFAQDDAAGLGIPKLFRLLHVLAKDFQIAKGDLRGISPQGSLRVSPQIDAEQVGVVGVIGQVPIEVSSLLGEFGKGVEKVLTRNRFLWFLRCMRLGPMMIE